MNNPTLIRRTMINRILTPLLAALLLGLLPVPHKAAAADDDLTAIKTELEALRQSQDQTRNELTQLRKLLESRLTPPQEPKFEPTVVDLGASPVRGDAKATVVLLEAAITSAPSAAATRCRCCRRFLKTMWIPAK